jgi:hypothetical protein
VGGTTFDALVFGYYEAKDLLYAARTRNGFTPASRATLLKKMRPLETTDCPFTNLPESKNGRWGQGLTAEKMKAVRIPGMDRREPLAAFPIYRLTGRQKTT